MGNDRSYHDLHNQKDTFDRFHGRNETLMKTLLWGTGDMLG